MPALNFQNKTSAGEIAYQAYRTAMGSKDRQGNAIRVWAETEDTLRQVWEQVAAAVEDINACYELRGRWYVSDRNGQAYLIPCEKWREWEQFFRDAESGEASSVVPNFALAVPSNVIITRVLR